MTSFEWTDAYSVARRTGMESGFPRLERGCPVDNYQYPWYQALKSTIYGQK